MGTRRRRGRLPKGKEEKLVRVAAYITEEEARQLEAMADREQRSVSAMIHILLQRVLRQRKKP